MSLRRPLRRARTVQSRLKKSAGSIPRAAKRRAVRRHIGIVNNAVYLHYLEHTRHEFCEAAGISFRQMHARGLDPVVTHIDIRYMRSLGLGVRTVGVTSTTSLPEKSSREGSLGKMNVKPPSAPTARTASFMRLFHRIFFVYLHIKTYYHNAQ